MSQDTRRKSRKSFGPTAPPFIDYLKEVLRRYPDGGQILKELIQNADDAEATEVVFIHDERSYGTKELWAESLGKYQGPALYAYNNAAFTDDDWAGIQSAGRSIKRDDPNKVGRFGIGFNSVYHVTDLPSVFSSGHLGFMDPQQRIFGDREVGFLWSLDDEHDQDVLMNLHDQFQPFRDIVSSLSGIQWAEIIKQHQYFDGTIFRFPLRNEASEISDNLYDSTKVSELYESFIMDADVSLLFLKNVTKVSLIHIDVNGFADTRLTLQSEEGPILERRDNPFMDGSTRFRRIRKNGQEETKWLVTSCTMMEGVVEALDLLGKKLSFSPQVDLAFPCGERSRVGRLSCFLPLPNNESNKTGFPVNVNACFGLTDNRRHIKWQEEDQKNDEHALWNELLMKEVLPRCYVLMIQDAIKLAQVGDFSAAYDIWPHIAEMQHKEKWCPIALNVLGRLFSQNAAILSLAKDETNFVSPSEAVFPCNGPTSPEVLAAIQKSLVSHGENLVKLPSSIFRTMMDVYPEFWTLKHVTPAFVRNDLQRFGVDGLTREEKLFLLEYVLSDGRYEELRNLALLPLSDGSFRCFSDREEDTALVDSEEFPRLLLPFRKHIFISEDVSSSSKSHLNQLAQRGLFRVSNLNAEKVVEWTRRHMPEEWKQTKLRTVTWDVHNNSHPPLAWLQEFWKFLNAHFRELRQLTDLPLIPVSPLSASQPVSLAKLSLKTTLIFQRNKQTNLPKQVVELINQVGGTVVTGNEWLKHDDLDSFILFPSASSVMKVLTHLDLPHIIRSFESVSGDARQQLKNYLSGLDSLSDREREVCFNLPLFQNIKGLYVGAQSKQAVRSDPGLTLPEELPLPDSVVVCTTEVDQRLLQLLKCELLNTAKVAEQLVQQVEQGRHSRVQIKQIMIWILQHGNLLFAQNQALKSKCKDLTFIELNGVVKKTSSFLDPRVRTFKELFGAEFSPPDTYMKTPQMIESLTNLGLIVKEGDVTPEHLLHVAQQIVKLQAQSPSEALKKSVALLDLLDVHNLLAKFSEQDLSRLKNLKWLSSDKRSHSHKSPTFFCPNEARHPMYEDIVGHVMPLIGSLSDKVSCALGLKCLPPPEMVIKNLMYWTSKAEPMSDLDTNVDFKRQLHSIYKHMQEHASELTSLLSKDTPWLWNQDKFVSPQELVMDHPPGLDLSSWIGKLPKEFRPYQNLLRRFGLRENLSDQEIVETLFSIAKATEKEASFFASSADVKVSVEILNWLRREKKTVQCDIPVPVKTAEGKYIFKPRSMAVFCDVGRKGLEELTLNHEKIHVTHEEIVKVTAEWLGIRLLSTHILKPELVGIEQCGQSEPITTRIKNILKEYDEEKDIFKELIQNAEDAGAKTCKFLVDFRVHSGSSEDLIDPGMATSQGPCLWAFNDEQFTPEDWENIVRVGSASKENKLEKIGKFGLGFNAVYHVTDLPSILSGKHLLILDPNVTHLKEHIKHKTNPGIKLDLSHETLLKCFPGQFSPYENIFDCSFTKSSPPAPYHGTLIKLPFRTEAEAHQSEICQKVFDKHRVSSFQDHLKSKSKTHLLFLKNINSLTLKNLSKDASTPPLEGEFETLLALSKTTEVTMPVLDDTFVSKQKDAVQRLQKLDRKCQEIIECFSVEIVNIASQQSGDEEFWLRYNCFGSNQSLKIASGNNIEAKFSLPIGGIAVPLKRDPATRKFHPTHSEHSGQAFCFLPLSIHTGLPVNVNGTFAVTSNRKGLWGTGIKHEWNAALLQDPLVTAYLTALDVLKRMSDNGQLVNYCYHTYWPDRQKVSDTFKPLVDTFYSTISQRSFAPKLLSDGTHWCSMEDSIFLHNSIQEDKNVSALAMQICQTYTKNVVQLPLWLRESFRLAGLENVLQEKTWNWERFYERVVFQNLVSLDTKSRDTLVLHAIDLNIKELDKLLLRYPCIPTTDGQLQFIQKLVDPSGRVACLFEESEGRLLGGSKTDYRSPKRMKRLIELGMASGSLALKDITERARLVNNTWKSDQKKAYVHVECLLELLRGQSNEDQAEWQALRETEFLPAFSPGDVRMEKCATFKRPTDVFNKKCSLLVNMTQHVLDQVGLKIHINDPLLRSLGIRDSPSPEMVLNQLEEVQKQSRFIDRTSCHDTVRECYKYLDQWLCDSKNPAAISCKAKSFPFILVGHSFVNVSHVAEEASFEAKPYLHILPPSIANFRNLWECVGVEKTFTTHQLLTVLQELKGKHGNHPLPATDLKICLTILRGIYHAAEEMPDNILIPNASGILQPATALFFNDSPWMPITPNLTLSHEDIPRNMALHFGIHTTRHHTLQIHVSKSISPHAFEFEQHEELTQRIKNIISAYPSKKDILKELIQNADDAEASEIHFVWDRREHGTEKTFGEKWNRLQGPALCVYNNKVFSDADLKGIQQLGLGGKQNSPGKIGKYGVGFNSVYHLTDCPSIVTGDSLLCIFDPNQSYIENQSEKPPSGIGYNLAATLKEMYHDVYQSFLPDKFCLKEGTMFRLPLRDSDMADSSRISKREVSVDDMTELFLALTENPEGLIMFLKNIRKIELHEITDDSGALRFRFSVKKSVPEASREVKDNFVRRLQDAQRSPTPVAATKAIYESVISSSDGQESKWIIAEQFGSDVQVEPAGKVPQAAISVRVSVKISQSKSEAGALGEFKGEAFCSLPLPGTTGLPAHINGNFEVDFARRSLWKEDGQSGKVNWNESLKEKIIAPLYADLLHHIRCHLPNRKVGLSGIEAFLESTYLCFWPVVTKSVPPEWHEMIRSVYRSIRERDIPLIPVMKSSTRVIADRKFREYSFDWCGLTGFGATERPYLTECNAEFNAILEDLGMKLVPSQMKKIWQGFKSADIKVNHVEPPSVRAFLKVKPLNDPQKTTGNLPLPISQTLIRSHGRWNSLLSFCLQDLIIKKETQEDYASLIGMPLLLTCDDVLGVFSADFPKLHSWYSSVFCGYESHFVHNKLDSQHVSTLLKFRLISKVTVPAVATWLTEIIQRLLKYCALEPQTGLHVPNETTVTWLKTLWKFFASHMFLKGEDGKPSLTLKHVQQLFSDACILPVMCPRFERRPFLAKMKDMQRVLWPDSTSQISDILLRMGTMQYNSTFSVDVEDDLIHQLHAALLRSDDKCAVLDHIYNLNHSEFSHLSKDDAEALQNFLQSGVSNTNDSRDYLRKLRCLPLFETIHGERVSISGPQVVFVLSINESTKTDFANLFNLPASNTVFLKNTPENSKLAQLAGIEILTQMTYFMKFILPRAGELDKQQMTQCLRLTLLLQHEPKYSDYKDSIVSKLKSLKVICSSQGNMERAAYYFDEDVVLFRAMLPPERLIPQTFWTELCDGNFIIKQQLKRLLIELDMRHCVSQDDIIGFAREIERKAKEQFPLEELKNKSQLVFKTALKMATEQTEEEELLDWIADIEFIFPVQIRTELCDYHPPFRSPDIPVKILGSLIDSDGQHQQLIWSAMPIIKVPLLGSEKLQVLTNAGAVQHPPSEFIVRNLSNICQSPCDSEPLLKTRAAVFRNSYGQLQATGFEGRPLDGLPVVLVERDTRLVRARDTSLKLEDDLDFRPYFYMIPPKYVVYKEFFMEIGVKEDPTVEQYCSVLAAVHAESSSKQQLHLNQEKTVKRAIQHLFHLIKESPQPQSLFQNVQRMYLLSADRNLYPSDSLYYNDTAFKRGRLENALRDRYQLLENLCWCHLGFDPYEHNRLVRLLPEALRPKMLSHLTKEKLGEGNQDRCELGTSCEFSGWFHRHLTSAAFRYGLICLIRAHSQGEVTHEEASDRCDKVFGSIQIVCCRSLRTQLWMQDEALPDTVAETDVLVTPEPFGCVFFLKHSDTTGRKVMNEVILTLTKEVSSLLGDSISKAHNTVIGLLLVCDSLEDVQDTLAKHEIHNSADGYSPSTAAPGTEIPEEWLDSLDMNVLNNYEEGEYVGYYTNDKYVYAVVLETIPGSTGLYSRRFMIYLGDDEPKEVSCLDIYQIKCGQNQNFEETASGSSSMEIQLVVGAVPRASPPAPPPQRSFPTSLEEAKKEIDKCLAEIWTLPQEDKNKAIKRLYLRWHPDKNPDCIQLATEAFKYLKNRIKELNQGKGSTSHQSSPFSSSSGSHFNFRNFYSTWDHEARHHRTHRENFSRSHRSYNFWSHHANVPRADRAEARRWTRQAQCDLSAAHRDSGQSSEWCLFKIHQAVEKALIAAELRRTGKRPDETSILCLAQKVKSYSGKLARMPALVQELMDLGVDAKRTQYPNYHPFPRIPNEAFANQDAARALDQASVLLRDVDSYVN
ncbi:sacsin [Neosynchiropus ocellatus]